jgi:hypothetical protein
MTAGLGFATLAFLFGGYLMVPAEGRPIREVGVDRMVPTSADRQLRTTSAHLYLREKDHAPLRLGLQLGVTGTRVRGTITQLEGSWEGGDLRSTTYDSPAWGFGPSVAGRITLLGAGSVRLSADVSASILLYDRRFPAGGERYNGMFQAGPTAAFDLGAGQSLQIGYRWMHVSNGRGPGPDNPAYEGRGVSLRYRWAF